MSCRSQHRWVDEQFLASMKRSSDGCPFLVQACPCMFEQFARFLLDHLPGPEVYLTREFIDKASRDLQREFKEKLAVTLHNDMSREMAIVIWTLKAWKVEPDITLEAITKSYLRMNPPRVQC